MNKILTSAKTIRVLIYCLLPLLVSLGLLNSSQPRLNMIVSDLLYLVSLYKDLFVDRYSVLGWNLTPAPYFFPDMVMFFPLLWIMPDIGYAFVLYSVLFLLLFLAIITKIASYLNSNIFNCFLCIFSAGLIFVVLLENSNYVSLGLIFLFPSAHGGAIIIGFMLIAISLNALQKGYSSVSSAMFFTLSCLTIISDILIIPQFLIPLVIANFILYRLRFIPLRNFLIPVGLIVVAQLVASIILKVIKILGIFKTTTQKAINYFPNLWRLITTFSAFIRDLNYYFNITTSLFIMFACFLVISVNYLWKNRQYLLSNKSSQSSEEDTTPVIYFLIIFSFLSILATVAAPIVVGNWADRHNIRYMQPLYILPLFVLALILATYKDKRAFWLKLIGFSTVVIVSLHQIIPGAIALEAASLRLPYSEMVQCLDRLAMDYDLQYGYSDYWNAKYTTILSRSGVRVNQLGLDLNIFPWINNPAWYTSKVGEGSGQYPKYQFILTERLSKAEIEARFGFPAIRKECPGTEIYIYNRNSDIGFRNFLRIPAIIANRREVSSSLVSPKSLRQYVPNGIPWNAPGTVIIPKNGELTVQFDPPVVSEILEIAADSNDEYVVYFFMDETLLGQLSVSMIPKPGIQARYLPLPKSILAKPFNRLVVQPLQGDGSYSLGHLFFYEDS